MARRKFNVFKVIGWIVLSFLTLILLTTLGFYLGRGWIMDRAVSYINESQPGELQMERMNLIPFMNFPDVSLQLKALTYYEREVHPGSLYQEPILSLNEVYVTLDVVDLIRREIQVSEIRLEKGFLKIEVYADSVTNLEKALGIQLKDYQSKSKDSSGKQLLGINLDQIELSDIVFILNDQTGDSHISLLVNELESSLSYLPDKIDASIQLNIDIDSVKYLTYSDKTGRNVTFQSEVSIDPLDKIIKVSPSTMEFSGLELETWGVYEYFNEPRVDFEFRASNEGLELLNYIFRGVLDLNEIEQIGSGSMTLSGNIRGSFGDSLPVISVSGNASQIGFRIKSIQKDVTAISFDLSATNGKKLDFSEGLVKVEGFTATFPEGMVNANITAINMLSPKLKIELEGALDLLGMDNMIDSDLLSELEGDISFKGQMEGVFDRETKQFLNSVGSLKADLRDVGFTLHGDSLKEDSVKHLYGQIFLKDSILGTGELTGEYNGNPVELDLLTENLLLYMLGVEVDVKAELHATAEVLKVATLLKDTAMAKLLGEELHGLHFRAGAMIRHQELEAYLKTGSVPRVEIFLDSFGIELPVYADVSNLNAAISFGQDSIALHYLNGVVGESEFEFSGHIANYGSFTRQDSSALVSVGFDISSELMRAEDFFTVNGGFLLPEIYRSEYLEDFHIAGTIAMPAEGLIHDSISLDFGLNIWDLGWNFRYYPLSFEDFIIVINREGERLFIEEFQGKIGESNLKMKATLENFTDTVLENLKGEMVLESDLLDFNKLLNYHVPEESLEATKADLPDSAETSQVDKREPPRLDQIEYPSFNFVVDIGELRYGDFNFFDLKGRLRSSSEKIFHLDELSLAGKSGGHMTFFGQFNVANPYLYTFSAEMELQDMNVDDLDIPMQMGDTIYRLKETFDGLVSANGLAEIFITPDLNVDMSNTTAVFNVRIEDGALINFKPLQAAAKYLDNKDLNFVKFATLQNSSPLTLMDSRIIVPLMNIESTVGQMLIEGEQGLDKSFLYLVRIPPYLAREAAKSVLSNAKDKGEEEQIQEMKRGNFYSITVWSDGIESDFKLGDRRSKFEE